MSVKKKQRKRREAKIVDYHKKRYNLDTICLGAVNISTLRRKVGDFISSR
jgi:hypothetical protein